MIVAIKTYEYMFIYKYNVIVVIKMIFNYL